MKIYESMGISNEAPYVFSRHRIFKRCASVTEHDSAALSWDMIPP